MASVSSRKTVHGGNSFVIGQIPQALRIFIVSVEVGIKARPTWLPQQQTVTGSSILSWCSGHLDFGLGASIRAVLSHTHISSEVGGSNGRSPR